VEITVRESNDINIIDLEGSLDTGTAPVLNGKLDELTGGGVSKILIVLTGVDFVSSAGLRVLLATTKKLRKTGGDLRLCGLNETVQEVFEISGFDSLMKVFGEEADAMSDF
jgi:anti-anti-sigma factor